MKDNDVEDEEARKLFKLAAMTEMLQGCRKIGVPLTPFQTKRLGKKRETSFAEWPIVKAIVDWPIKKSMENSQTTEPAMPDCSIKINKSLLKPVDISPDILRVDDGLDPIQLHSCLVSNVNQLQRQIENVGNFIDVKVGEIRRSSRLEKDEFTRKSLI